jgi:hypothetical protein
VNAKIDIPLPKYAFWDVSTETLDLSKNRNFIVSRMFERGKLDDVFSVIAFYGEDETKNILLDNKYLNRYGLFLAHALLGLPLVDFKAYATLKHD